MKNLFVIRHPKADIASGICYGQLDVGLDDGWHVCVRGIMGHPVFQTASKIKLVTSPLKRCVLLSEALVLSSNKMDSEKKLRNKVIFSKDDRLKELDFGDWEGIAWDDINAQDLERWSLDYQNVTVPNGESWQDLKLRCKSLLEDCKSSQAQELVVFVTHAGVIRTLMHLINGTDLNDLFSQPVPYAEPIELEVNK